jgi:hypothetical protein
MPQIYHRYNFPKSFYCTFNAIYSNRSRQPGFRAGDIPGSKTLLTADQMCCWHSETIGGRWYVNCYTLSSLYAVLKLLVWEKKWRRSNLKNGDQIWKKFRRPGRVLVELPRPSALRTRLMHFSLWNNNLGYQGILECQITASINKS